MKYLLLLYEYALEMMVDGQLKYQTRTKGIVAEYVCTSKSIKKTNHHSDYQYCNNMQPYKLLEVSKSLSKAFLNLTVLSVCFCFDFVTIINLMRPGIYRFFLYETHSL